MLAQRTPDQFVIGMIRDPLSWEHWPTARAYLDPALALSDDEWPQVEADLSSEAKQLWVVMDGLRIIGTAITRMALTKRGEVIEVYLVGGESAPLWLAALDNMLCENAPPGVVGLRAYGREGWKRPLAAQGWRVSSVSYEKAL
jgi:hypothetical protein